MSGSWLSLALALGATAAWLAARKGYPPRTWFWLGALLGVIALGVLSRQPRRVREEERAPEP